MNREVIKKKISNAIQGISKEISVSRNGEDQFGQPIGDVPVTTITGYYRRLNRSVGVDISEAGNITENIYEQFITICDSDSVLVKKNDYFELDGIDYEVIDINNVYNIYFEWTLQRV